ncbi:Nucleotidylyl transferase [Pholiota molesta]|nr:Nucleotidylyl transferase [Pholiota molesta]
MPPQRNHKLVDNALLLATLPNLTLPHFLSQVIAQAVTYTRKRLIIVLFSRYFNVHRPQSGDDADQQSLTFPEMQGLSHTLTWDAVQRILTYTYVQATKVALEMNKVLMEVDVLLKADIGVGMGICFRINGDTIAVPLPESISALREMYLEPGDRFLATLLRILLSMGAFITSRKLIIGITDDALLQNKANKHVLEKLPRRMQRVHDFVRLFKPEILADIVPINDVYGPTGWDPDIQALVVSKETLSGAEAIAKHRAAHNLPPLRTFLIDVISSTHINLDNNDMEWLKTHKLSSTYIRQWIVDTSKEEEEEDEEEARGKANN